MTGKISERGALSLARGIVPRQSGQARISGGGLEPILLEIGTVTDPVHHGIAPRRADRCKHPVPGIAQKVDPLPRTGQEGMHRPGCAACILGHGDKKGHLIKRQERLRAERVTFDEIEPIGQGAGLCVEQADARAPLPDLGREIQPCEVVMAPTHPLIDDPVGWPRDLDQIAERRESLRRQWLDADDPAHVLSFRATRQPRS